MANRSFGKGGRGEGSFCMASALSNYYLTKAPLVPQGWESAELDKISAQIKRTPGPPPSKGKGRGREGEGTISSHCFSKTPMIGLNIIIRIIRVYKTRLYSIIFRLSTFRALSKDLRDE